VKRGPSRFSAEIWIKPTARARSAARRALALRESLPKSRRAGTAAGLARARSIARGEMQPAREIAAWFARHGRSILAAERRGETLASSRALQAAALWGGEPMARAAFRAVGR
jgi:hypothetical protein